MGWFLIFVGAAVIFTLLVWKLRSSCSHVWKKVKALPIKYDEADTFHDFDVDGILRLDQCEKCKCYQAEILTPDGPEPINVKYAKEYLNVE